MLQQSVGELTTISVAWTRSLSVWNISKGFNLLKDFGYARPCMCSVVTLNLLEGDGNRASATSVYLAAMVSSFDARAETLPFFFHSSRWMSGLGSQ